MTTPTGSPIWSRAAGFADYGGHENKQDYLGQGVVDPETDVGASQLQRLSADLAAIARTAPFGFFRVQCNDTVPAAPTIELVLMSTNTRFTSYEGNAPPSGFPTFTRTNNGVFTVTFASSYSDEYGVSAPLIIQPGGGSNLTTNGGTLAMVRNSNTQITVRAYDQAGVLDADALVTFSVYSGGA